MKKNLINMVFLLIILLLLIGILINPQLSLKGATEGLITWFNIVLPSLLPFFIISEILIAIGFLDIIGNFLEPLMRPLFNLPGIAAFPFSMSIISGYPTGSKIVASLRKDNLITKTEGERMLVLSSTSGPLFMLGAVTVGMFNNLKLAPLILYPHYLGAITMGFLFRFYKHKDNFIKKNKKNSIKLAKFKKRSFFNKNYPPIGFILMNSVKNSMNSILLIGGFIIFYSVIIELLFASKPFSLNYYVFPIDINILQGLLAGILELTTGCKKITCANVDLITKITIINFIIGWGGISIHSQVLAFLSNTDLNGRIYIIAKFFHGILASIYGVILYKLKYKKIIETTFFTDFNTIDSIYFIKWPTNFINSIKLSILIVLYLFISSLIMMLVWYLLRRK